MFFYLDSLKVERVAVNYKDVGSNPILGVWEGNLTVKCRFSMPYLQVQLLSFPEARVKESPDLIKRKIFLG